MLAVEDEHPEVHDVVQLIFELVFETGVHLVRNVEVGLRFFDFEIFDLVQLLDVVFKHLVSVLE